MSRMVSAREIVGRTIVRFDPDPVPDGRGTVHPSPHIYLDDGSILSFTTEETFDGGFYGTHIGRHKPAKTQRSNHHA